MGTWCRNLKKQTKGLGGIIKNSLKLTDKVINKLQKYYGLAITRHQDNVDEMYKVKTPVRNPRPLCNRLNLRFDFPKTASKISS